MHGCSAAPREGFDKALLRTGGAGADGNLAASPGEASGESALCSLRAAGLGGCALPQLVLSSSPKATAGSSSRGGHRREVVCEEGV